MQDGQMKSYYWLYKVQKLFEIFHSSSQLSHILGVRKFGKNFSAIASILGTKTESHVRSFFVNYKRRYNLDVAYKEYEAEFGPTDSGDNEENPEGKEDVNGMDIKESDNSPKTSLPNSPRSKSPATGNKVNGSAK